MYAMLFNFLTQRKIFRRHKNNFFTKLEGSLIIITIKNGKLSQLKANKNMCIPFGTSGLSNQDCLDFMNKGTKHPNLDFFLLFAHLFFLSAAGFLRINQEKPILDWQTERKCRNLKNPLFRMSSLRCNVNGTKNPAYDRKIKISLDLSF